MNAKKFSDAMNELDTKYIEEALKYKKKVQKTVWIKWGSMAACLLIIIGCVFMTQRSNNDMTVISKYDTDFSGVYAAPSPGTVSFSTEVKEARKKYDGKNVTFLLSFDMFKKDGEGQIVELSEEERMEEYQRLISLGYELYTTEYWDYQENDQKKYYTIVVGYFTESDLTQFKNNPEYGYFFDFEINGDGSGISADKTNSVTSFLTNCS